MLTGLPMGCLTPAECLCVFLPAAKRACPEQAVKAPAYCQYNMCTLQHVHPVVQHCLTLTAASHDNARHIHIIDDGGEPLAAGVCTPSVVLSRGLGKTGETKGRPPASWGVYTQVSNLFIASSYFGGKELPAWTGACHAPCEASYNMHCSRVLGCWH